MSKLVLYGSSELHLSNAVSQHGLGKHQHAQLTQLIVCLCSSSSVVDVYVSRTNGFLIEHCTIETPGPSSRLVDIAHSFTCIIQQAI